MQKYKHKNNNILRAILQVGLGEAPEEGSLANFAIANGDDLVFFSLC